MNEVELLSQSDLTNELPLSLQDKFDLPSDIDFFSTPFTLNLEPLDKSLPVDIKNYHTQPNHALIQNKLKQYQGNAALTEIAEETEVDESVRPLEQETNSFKEKKPLKKLTRLNSFKLSKTKTEDFSPKKLGLARMKTISYGVEEIEGDRELEVERKFKEMQGNVFGSQADTLDRSPDRNLQHQQRNIIEIDFNVEGYKGFELRKMPTKSRSNKEISFIQDDEDKVINDIKKETDRDTDGDCADNDVIENDNDNEDEEERNVADYHSCGVFSDSESVKKILERRQRESPNGINSARLFKSQLLSKKDIKENKNLDNITSGKGNFRKFETKNSKIEKKYFSHFLKKKYVIKGKKDIKKLDFTSKVIGKELSMKKSSTFKRFEEVKMLSKRNKTLKKIFPLKIREKSEESQTDRDERDRISLKLSRISHTSQLRSPARTTRKTTIDDFKKKFSSIFPDKKRKLKNKRKELLRNIVFKNGKGVNRNRPIDFPAKRISLTDHNRGRREISSGLQSFFKVIPEKDEEGEEPEEESKRNQSTVINMLKRFRNFKKDKLLGKGKDQNRMLVKGN